MLRLQYNRFLDLLSYISIVITGTAMVFLTTIFGWLVYGRYVLNSTPTWVEQASLLLIALICFLGAATGIHLKYHLCVTLFMDRCSVKVQKVCALIGHFVMGTFGIVMAINSYHLVIFKWGSDIPLLGLPEGLRAIPMMIAGALILLYSLGHFLNLLADDS